MGTLLLPFVSAGVAMEDMERIRPVAVFVRILGCEYRNALDDGNQSHLRTGSDRFRRRSFPKLVYDKLSRRSARTAIRIGFFAILTGKTVAGFGFDFQNRFYSLGLDTNFFKRFVVEQS